MEEQQERMQLESIEDQIGQKIRELANEAVQFAREQPHLAVGLAFGLGWVLGNGLSPRLLVAGARLGWKAALGGALAGGGLMSILSGTHASTMHVAGTPQPGARRATPEDGATHGRTGSQRS